MDVKELNNWLLKEGLKEFELESLFVAFCERIANDFDLYRISIGMPTLHPLVEAKTLRWYRQSGLDFFESEHGYSEGDDWRLSPISYMFENSLEELRYRIDRTGEWQRFPIIDSPG